MKGQKEPTLNETVCHEGQTSGHSCGEITAAPVLGTNFIKAQGGGVFSEPGDSGGPWYYPEANLEVLMMSLFGLMVWVPSFFIEPRPSWATSSQNQWSELITNLALAATAWLVASALRYRPWLRRS